MENKKSTLFAVIVFLVVVFQCTACSSKAPKDAQIKSDIEDYVSDWTITYQLDEAYDGTNMVFEEHTLQIKDIEVEKSISENRSYNGWLKISLEDEDLAGEVYMKVEYTKYDKNKWELNYCEEYKNRKSEYIGSIDANRISDIFTGDLTVNDVELLDYRQGKTAVVNIQGTNAAGYDLYTFDEVREFNDSLTVLLDEQYPRSVDFEAEITFRYSQDSLTWRADSIALGDVIPKTVFDDSVLDYALRTSFERMQKMREENYGMPLADYKYELPENGEVLSFLSDIDSFADIEKDRYSMGLAYDFTNSTKYCSEKSQMMAVVDFGLTPGVYMEHKTPFTYNISLCNVGTKEREWNVDTTVDRWLKQGERKINIVTHIIYPYENDTTKVYAISQNKTDDPEGQHIFVGAYEAEPMKSLVYIEVPVPIYMNSDFYGYPRGEKEWLNHSAFGQWTIHYDEITVSGQKETLKTLDVENSSRLHRQVLQ